MISEKLGLAKSTLSDWLRDIDFPPNRKVLLRIKDARKKLVKTMYKKRRDRLKFREKIKNDHNKKIKKLTQENLCYIATALYLTEGNKSQKEVRITNSDPWVIKLIVRWLRKICKIKTENFSAAINLYPDNNINKAVQFWSKISKILVF